MQAPVFMLILMLSSCKTTSSDRAQESQMDAIVSDEVVKLSLSDSVGESPIGRIQQNIESSPRQEVSITSVTWPMKAPRNQTEHLQLVAKAKTHLKGKMIEAATAESHTLLEELALVFRWVDLFTHANYVATEKGSQQPIFELVVPASPAADSPTMQWFMTNIAPLEPMRRFFAPHADQLERRSRAINQGASTAALVSEFLPEWSQYFMDARWRFAGQQELWSVHALSVLLHFEKGLRESTGFTTNFLEARSTSVDALQDFVDVYLEWLQKLPELQGREEGQLTGLTLGQLLSSFTLFDEGAQEVLASHPGVGEFVASNGVAAEDTGAVFLEAADLALGAASGIYLEILLQRPPAETPEFSTEFAELDSELGGVEELEVVEELGSEEGLPELSELSEIERVESIIDQVLSRTPDNN